MPAPSQNLVPKQEYWGFVQKDVTASQLTTLAKNIVANDGNDVDIATKTSVLNFLTGDPVQLWSDYWVTIINTLGIGYTTTADNKLHKTTLTDYLANGGNSNEFYLLWSLLFQFPFAQSKHKEFKENNIVVNPCQIIVEALVYLSYISRNTGNKDPFREAYLTVEEIVLVLMKLTSNSTLDIQERVNLIYKNRITSFDYTTMKIQGHDTVMDNFSGRARLYLEKSNLIKFSFDNSKIQITDWKHFGQCQNYLSYRRNGMKIDLNAEENSRISFFEKTFSEPNLNPADFFNKVHSSDIVIDNSNVEFDEVKAVLNKLMKKGFSFTEEFVERFLLSAKAKPFIILSGISGVGKTLLPRAIMEILDNGNCRPIAVSPDWTDNSDMLGYFGADGKFISGEFTNIVIEASKNLHIPYFIVLDEMNLAKVEYYFAQILSVMESRYYDPYTGCAQHFDSLFNIGIKKRLSNSVSQFEREISDLRIPANLVIIGTVNIDESTHPFSKKVLDRANVLEINDVDLMIGVQELTTIPPDISILPNTKNFTGSITNLKELFQQWTFNYLLENKYDFNSFIGKWIKQLDQFNEILKVHKLNFGLRMRDEVCIYMYYGAIRNLDSSNPDWDNKYFDHQVVQKLLTRLEGEEGEIEDTLFELFKLCFTDSSQILDHESVVNFSDFGNPNLKYPITSKKLQKMLFNLVVNRRPMVSFWTS